VDLISIIRATFRRWYVSLPVVVATVVGLLAVMSSFPAAYQTSTTVLVIGPQQSVIGTSVVNVNPFAYLSDSVKVMALAGTSVVNSQQVREKIEAEGFGADYVTQVQPGTSFIDVAVNGTDRGATARTTERVLDELAASIEGFQARSPAGQRLSVQVLQEPNVFEAEPDGSSRLLLMIAALGLAAAVGAAVGVDLLVARRATRGSRAPLPTLAATVASPDAGTVDGPGVGGLGRAESAAGGNVSPDTVRLRSLAPEAARATGPVRSPTGGEQSLVNTQGPGKP
jgi:hypothetical protein